MIQFAGTFLRYYYTYFHLFCKLFFCTIFILNLLIIIFYLYFCYFLIFFITNIHLYCSPQVVFVFSKIFTLFSFFQPECIAEQSGQVHFKSPLPKSPGLEHFAPRKVLLYRKQSFLHKKEPRLYSPQALFLNLTQYSI